MLLSLVAVGSTAQTVDFDQVHQSAQRSQVVYKSAADIRRQYPNVVHITTVADTQVQYFLERFEDRQVVTVRGTANLQNFAQDADYDAVYNSELGIYVHDGFNEDVRKLYGDLTPYLDKSRPVQITGHSLGAALGSLLMMYLHVDGFELLPSINFGQPKVTNEAGAKKYQFLPLLRVVDENDLVPLVPPAILAGMEHGGYQHFGREVILLSGAYYVYLDKHLARQRSDDSFWNNLGDESISQHYMANYLKNIEPKRRKAMPVKYSERENYIPEQ